MKKKFILSVLIITILGALTACFWFNKKDKQKALAGTSLVPYAAPLDKDYIYLTDLWDTDKMLTKESSWKDARALKINQNEPGNLISLNVSGNQKYFINGLFAHAESTLVFNIRDFVAAGFDTFSAYLGVDTYAKSNGNGVRFTILGSTDGHSYIKLFESSNFKGTSEAKEVVIRVKEYNYLKLFADDLGSNSSDHAVYANAMLYNSSKYTAKASAEVEWIKPLEEYDKELEKHDAKSILSNKELELKLLQRTLVDRVGYQIMQAYATSDDSEKVATLKWLFNNYDILKAYLSGGEPLGNYVSSFNILSSLYDKYKSDLTNEEYSKKDREVFLKMMMAISLTHSGTVALWTTGENGALVKADPVKRYEAYKELYLNENLPEEYEQTFKKDVFASLTIEEMRWVVDARLSDEEIPWLNWFSSHLDNTKYTGRNGMDPYTYIWYDDSFDWRYTDPKYYEENTDYCGKDLKSKFTTGFARGLNCNQEYSLDKWGVGSNTPTKPRLWIIWEEDGVCGAISKTGENLYNSYGMVAAVTRQPAHAAFLIQNKTLQEDGTYKTTWSIGNDVSGWAKSSGTEKGERLPLNWGTTTNSYASNFNASYVILATSALEDYDNYLKALEYTFMADMYEDNISKQRSLYRDIVGNSVNVNHKNESGIQNFNLDGWYGLIKTYLADEKATSTDFYNLSFEIMANLQEYPLAMNDMLKLIHDKMDGGHQIVVDSNFNKILTKLSTVPNDSTEYRQGQAVRQVALNLLNEQEESISFSFDGENAGKIVLATSQPFEYSLNYSYNASTKEVMGDWTKVTTGNMADLNDRLSEINAENDIVVHIMLDDDKTLTSNSITVIDIDKSSMPKNLYANDLENKVIGTSDSMEWKIENTFFPWTKFSDKMPDLTGMKTVLVRDGAHANLLASDAVSLTFEADPEEDKSKVYVPVSRLSVTASSQQNSSSEAAARAIDGNVNTYWHNLWSGADKERWIKLEVLGDEPIALSKLEYVPRQDTGSNGRFLKTKLEVSLDGENWTLVDDNIIWANDKTTKTYILSEPVIAKYIKLTALESAGGFASAAMINIFENTTTRVSVDDLSVSYMTGGYTYDGNPKLPEIYVKHNDKSLVLNEDYMITYEDNIKPGVGKFIIKGIGAYKGSKTFTFDIAKADFPSVVPDDNITIDKDITYLIYAYDVLPENWFWDFTEQERTIEPGETIEAKVTYFGDDAGYYNLTTKTVSVTRENGSKPVISLKEGATLRFNIDEKEPKTYDYFKDLLVITDEEDDALGKPLEPVMVEDLTNWDGTSWDRIGTYHITYEVKDSHNNKVNYVITFTLYSEENPYIEINHNEFTFAVDEVYYTGKAQTPHVTIKDKANHTLTLNTDYEINNYENNTNAGTAKVNIQGVKLYSGNVTPEFEIKKALVPEVLPQSTIRVSSSTKALGDIELPLGWTWKNAGLYLQTGENELEIIYAGDNNHESYEMKITVIKEDQERSLRETVNTPEESPKEEVIPSTNTEDNNTLDTNKEETKPNVEDNSKETNSNTNTNTTKPSTDNNSVDSNKNTNTSTNKTDNTTTNEIKDEENNTSTNEDKEDNTTYNKVTENTSENKDETPKDNKIIFIVLPVLVIVSIGLIFVFLRIKRVK